VKQLNVAGLCFVVLYGASAVAASPAVAIRGHRVSRLKASGGANSGLPQNLTVVVGLKWRNPDQLDQLLNRLSQPESLRTRRYLTLAEFNERFAPDAADVSQVVSYLKERELVISEISPSSQLITASGSPEAVEHAFGVRLVSVQQNGEISFAPDSDPVLPAYLSTTISSIQGLENRTQLQANNTGPRIPPQVGAPLQPADIARVYNVTPLHSAGLLGDDSRAATIAIASAFGFDTQDATNFWGTFGINRPSDRLEVIPVGGNVLRTIDETTLDVEWAGAMAPQSLLLVYEGADSSIATFTRIYDRIVSDNRAAVMTISWGLCESKMPSAYLDQTHAVFQKAAALGITVLAASGDQGAFDCGSNTLGVNYPASDPLVTAVGGTSLHLDAEGHRATESAWTGSGGGMSTFWGQTPWQMSFSSCRQSADVALNADPDTGYYVANSGAWWQYGGTSLAAPIWAAILALANQYRAKFGGSPIGAAGSVLCDLATQPNSLGRPLIDITTGDNGMYPATSGWDYPTGWGVPDAWLLANSLASGNLSRTATSGLNLYAYLAPVPPTDAGTVRAKFSMRCGHNQLTAAVRGLAAGLYRIAIDGTPIVEFAVARSGYGSALVNGVDPRGRSVTLLDDDDRVLFRSVFPAKPQSPVRMRARLQNPGLIPGASGTATYESVAGAERFRLEITGLPAAGYGLFAGAKLVAAIPVQPQSNGRASGVVRFDSSNVTGPICPVELSCQSLEVRLGEAIVLQLADTAPGTGICPNL
jgi:kumamolisin